VAKTKKEIRAFKARKRSDVCSSCPKRLPCFHVDSICDLVTPCIACEIRNQCTSLCLQMKSYLTRGKSTSPQTTQYHDIFDYSEEEGSTSSRKKPKLSDLPWQAIPKRNREIILDHFHKSMSYKDIAAKYKISKGRAYHIVHGYGKRKGALDILQSYKKYQDLYKAYGHYIPKLYSETLKQYYMEYKSVEQISKKKGETKHAVWYRLRKARELIGKFIKG